MLTRLLDRRLRKVREASGLPDIPEVRAFCRASWLNGFAGGRYESTVRLLELEVTTAVARTERRWLAAAQDPGEGSGQD
jgi:hypothetical protein